MTTTDGPSRLAPLAPQGPQGPGSSLGPWERREGRAARPEGGVAQRLAEALRPFVGGDLPVRLLAWDGSAAGPEDAPVVELRSPQAVRRLLWHPG